MSLASKREVEGMNEKRGIGRVIARRNPGGHFIQSCFEGRRKLRPERVSDVATVTQLISG